MRWQIPRMKTSVRTLLAVQLIVVLLAAWAADHIHQAHRIRQYRVDAQILADIRTLKDAVQAAEVAVDPLRYERASKQAVDALSLLIDRGSDAEPALGACIDAIRAPRRFDVDYSIRDEATICLAAIGSDAIPICLGLLKDKEPEVRTCAVRCLKYLTSADMQGGLFSRLDKDRAQELVEPLNQAVQVERDEQVAASIKSLLIELNRDK